MTLNDVCEFIADCPHSTAPDEGNGYPLIRTPNIGKGRLLLDGVHRVSKETYDIRNKRAVPQPDDIIFAREAPAGNAALIRPGQEVCLGQRTVLIRPNPQKVSSLYLVYYILAPQQQYKLLGTANGATVAHVNIPAIKEMPVELPPLETQIKIGESLSAYDDLIENNQKQIKLLEEAAQRLYKEWFVDLHFPGYENTPVVDGVPEGWTNTTVGEICSVKKQVIAPDIVLPQTPYIGLEHMPRNDICLCEWGKADDVSSNKYIYAENDIIFGKIRPYFHKVGFALNSGVASTDSFILNPKGELWGLLLMTVSSKEFVEYTYQTCKEGAKMPRADWNQMQKYPVLIPENTLLAEFEKHIKSITQEVKVHALKNRLLVESRDRLLPKLMSGEIAI